MTQNELGQMTLRAIVVDCRFVALSPVCDGAAPPAIHKLGG
ncbi:MAG: hypothetical protein OEV40_31935 [Acidimicrobiia bacterium]|nr:hypothetical protein [Acidimicrobiia bacterium]